MKKRLLAVVLSFVLVLAVVVPFGVSASGDVKADGTCGNGLTWTLNDGTLVVSKTEEGSGVLDINAVAALYRYHKYSDGIRNVVIEDGCVELGESAFEYFTELESIQLPVGLVKIGDCAFNGCTSLKTINFPEGLKEIGDSAFCECTSLEKVELPESLVSIADYAFYGCQRLDVKASAVPNGVVIGEGTFDECKA